MATEFSLPQQLLLLCLNDTTGSSDEIWVDLGLQGAVLAELMLHDRIGLEEKNRVVVRDASPLPDPILNQALRRIADSRHPRPIGEWIGERLIPNNPLKSHPVLRSAVSEQLVARGVLRRKEERHLGVIPDQTYPTLNPEPEQELRARLRVALLAEGPVEERLVILIALLRGAEALDRVLAPPEVLSAAARIQQLCDSAPAVACAGQAVSGAIEGQRTAALGGFLGSIASFFTVF